MTDQILDIDSMTRIEDALAASFANDMRPELAALDKATTLLGHTLEAVKPPRIEARILDEKKGLYETHDPLSAMLGANIFIGCRAVRVVRAARGVLGRGYELEARALDRIVVELRAHREVILDDPTGCEAIRWLRRDSRWDVGKKVEAIPGGGDGLYANLSSEAHGDPLPVMRMFDAEKGFTDLAPRRTSVTRASLHMHAGFCRDQAVAIAGLSRGQLQINQIEDLDAEIHAIERRLTESPPPRQPS